MKDPVSLAVLIQRCLHGDREAQGVLYQQYYGYAMSVCLRYTRTRDESKEILNDGFMKVFTRMVAHDTPESFKAWLRRIMINTAIDHYRKHRKHYDHQDSDDESIALVPLQDGSVVDELSYSELIQMVQQLSPGYRAVFNLHVIDGFTHEEIASQLDISVGASKSNLFKAREHLKVIFKKNNVKRYA